MIRWLIISLLFSVSCIVEAQVDRPCNIFLNKYNIQNGGVNWGTPFIEYARYQGRIVRKGRATFYAPSWEGDSLGGGSTTAWGIDITTNPLRHHVVAADRSYFGAGSIVYIKAIKNSAGNIAWPPDGSPGRLMIVADVGGAIKGPYRFDICVAGLWDKYRNVNAHHNVEVFVVYRTPVQRAWGRGYLTSHIETLATRIQQEIEEG